MDTVKVLGKYLGQLRAKRGVSLREVEKATGVSNAYLSLLETGGKAHLPAPEILNKLADFYNVSIEELLAKADYLSGKELGETWEQRIEKAFQHVTNDPRFRYGTRVQGELSLEAKRFIVEMYEKLMKTKLLNE